MYSVAHTGDTAGPAGHVARHSCRRNRRSQGVLESYARGASRLGASRAPDFLGQDFLRVSPSLSPRASQDLTVSYSLAVSKAPKKDEQGSELPSSLSQITAS